MSGNSYQVLGLASTATHEDVKTAYKKLALQHHPDKQTGKTQEEQDAAIMAYKEIQKAYQALCVAENNKVDHQNLPGELQAQLSDFNIDSTYFVDYPNDKKKESYGPCFAEIGAAWVRSKNEVVAQCDLFLLCWLDKTGSRCLNGSAVYYSDDTQNERAWVKELGLCDLAGVAMLEAAQEFRKNQITEAVFRTHASFVYQEVFNGGRFRPYYEMLAMLETARTRLQDDSSKDPLKDVKITQLDSVIKELRDDLKTQVNAMISEHLTKLKQGENPGNDFAAKKVNSFFETTMTKLRNLAQSENIKGRRNLIKDILRGALGVLLSFMAVVKSGRRVWNAAFFKRRTEANIDNARYTLEKALRR